MALLAVLALGTWGAFAVFAASSGPTVLSFTLNASSPSNASSVSWKVVFSASVTGVAAANFSLVQAGGVTGAGSIAVAGSGTTYTVSANSGSGSGTLGLNLSSAGSIKDSSNKALQGVPSTGPVYTIDKAAPSVSSIGRQTGAANPANAASVSWTVTFSEPVLNVATTNFGLASSGLGAPTPAVTTSSGSGATYTVTASTGSGSGSLGLNLTSRGAIADAAGNQLSTTSFTGQTYTLDRTPPPAPTIVSGPSGASNPASATFGFSDAESGVSYLCKLDSAAYAACSNPVTFSGLSTGSHTLSVDASDSAGNISTTAASGTWTVDATPPPKPGIVGPNNKSDATSATFTFSDSEAGVTYQCNLDGGAYVVCLNPKTFLLLATGSHEVDVSAVDAAGNVSEINGWKWSINGNSGAGQPFTISNPTLPLLYPGGATDSINLSLTNPNSVTIYITSLTVTFSVTPSPSATGPNPCSASLDFALTQYSGGYPITLPPGTKTLLQLGYTQAQWPSIKMLDRPLSQDRCKNASLNFTYGGSAQS